MTVHTHPGKETSLLGFSKTGVLLGEKYLSKFFDFANGKYIPEFPQESGTNTDGASAGTFGSSMLRSGLPPN